MDINSIKRLIDSHEIISFDIFDTLIARPYINPYSLFAHIERYTGCELFEKLRRKAESLARKNSLTEDVSIDDIYTHMPNNYQNLLEIELMFEETLCFPRRDVISLYDYALEQGKKIILISDMYLKKEFLVKLLGINGIKEYNSFYLSSEIGLTKHSGNLFKHVLEKENVDAKNILHIGDNENSDIKNAQKFGISTCRVQKIYENFLKNKWYKHFYEKHSNQLDVNIILFLISQKKQDVTCFWNRFGYLFGGPIAYGLTKFSLDIARKNKVNNLLYVARDGYTLKKISDILSADMFNTFYVHAQRVLAVRCLGKFGDEHNANLVLDLLREMGLVSNASTYTEKREFIEMHKGALDRFVEINLENYKKYLKSLGIKDSEEYIIVDSGVATFSAQRLLSAALNKNLTGVYSIATRPDYAFENGLTYNVWEEDALKITSLTSLIEFVLQAPEKPIKKIENQKIEYIENVSLEEQKRIEIAPFVSQGCVDFSVDVKKYYKEYLPNLSADFVNRYIEMLILSKDKETIANLKEVFCSSNASHSEYKQKLYDEILKSMCKKKIFFSLFGIKFFSFFVYSNCISIRILNYIKLFDFEKKDTLSVLKLFGILPVLFFKRKNKKISLKLFNLIRIGVIKI